MDLSTGNHFNDSPTVYATNAPITTAQGVRAFVCGSK